jgi:hypothetical protein
MEGDYFPPYNAPGGFTFNAASRVAKWGNASGVIFHISDHFSSLQCLVDSVVNDTVHFNHAVGCDQCPLFQAPGLGWYAENILAECDDPGEYFYSAHEKALYYTFNATEQPTGMEEFSLTTTKVILNVSGTQENPVKNVTIRGLTIRDAALTFLGTTKADVHYIPR